MVEAIEWAYEKSMAKVGKKEQVPLTEWLESAVQDPSKAPAVLRPHLQNLQAEAPEPAEAPMQAEAPEQVLERPTAPAVNTGAQAPVDGPSIFRRLLQILITMQQIGKPYRKHGEANIAEGGNDGYRFIDTKQISTF